MTRIFLKVLFTTFLISAFKVSKNQAEKNPYDLSVSLYPDYELLDKNTDSTSKLDFTAIDLLEKYVTNKYEDMPLYDSSTINSEIIPVTNRNPSILDLFLRILRSNFNNQETTPRNYIKSQKLQSILSKETSSGLDLDLSFASGLFGSSFQSRVKAIYPGTVWCGTGDSAKGQKDIGLFYVTDSCCKAHDTCPKFIPAKSELFGLKNTGTFTRSHCICDYAFLTCLKRANSFISNKMGYTYFTLLAPQCFREEHPVEGCAKFNEKRCISYIIDETKNKTWQWFDNAIY